LSSQSSVSITFIDSGGEEKVVEAEIGKNLLDVAHDNNIELEGKQFAMFPSWFCASMLLIIVDLDAYLTLAVYIIYS